MQVAVRNTILVIACSAIARELIYVTRLNHWTHIRLTCLPAVLHNWPHRIPDVVRETIEANRCRYETIFVAFADCGTGGRLDRVLAEHGIQRLPGAHCYEFLTGSAVFKELTDQEPGTFYLTDFLVRHFDKLVYRGLGLDRHPELLTEYFRNYHRLVYLAQLHDEMLLKQAEQCAKRVRLDFHYQYTGFIPLQQALQIVNVQDEGCHRS